MPLGTTASSLDSKINPTPFLNEQYSGREALEEVAVAVVGGTRKIPFHMISTAVDIFECKHRPESREGYTRHWLDMLLPARDDRRPLLTV